VRLLRPPAAIGYYDGSNHGEYQTIDSPSPYGLYDVVGNVEEWCTTPMKFSLYDPSDGREDPPAGEDEAQAFRGGSCGSREEWTLMFSEY
jgi:formylglycine-generating enzyme required for sulfatase activity